MKRLVVKSSRPGRYLRFRESCGRCVSLLEFYAARFFGETSNPFALTGALIVALMVVSAITGIAMLLHYTPTPETAVQSVRRLTDHVYLGSLVRALHRTSADLLVISILFHLFRNWATGRYTGPRSRNWVIGLLALPLIGIIGWSGYVLPWDERGMVLLAWGREIAYGPDQWPILGWLRPGSIIGWPLFSVSNEADQLLRIFALHVGGAFVAIWLVLRHLRPGTPPRARLPLAVWIGLALLLLVIAAMLPLENEDLLTFNPFGQPATVRVDALVSFPLLFYPIFGGSFLAFLILLVWIGLAWLPRFERRKVPAAVVSEIACTGCGLCYNDCPYGAIAMMPHRDPLKRSRGREIAKILLRSCNSCGICVGSCSFGAIELPALMTGEILSRIEGALRADRETTAKEHLSEGVV